MHGLYCLSRPSTFTIIRFYPFFIPHVSVTTVRISPATAKYKGPIPSTVASIDYAAGTFSTGDNVFPGSDQQQEILPLTFSIPNAQSQSVSGPLASHSAGSNVSLHTTSGSISSIPSLSSGPSSSSSTLASTVSEDPLKAQSNLAGAVQQQKVQNAAIGRPGVNSNVVNSITAAFAAQQVQGPLSSERYTISEESWKHHAQARAILSNLIGPNGEQLSSSDPYNTTVFVGGLSPLISEDTLRTFFAPFGDIHYVCLVVFSFKLPCY
jgi:RNA recognition motif. (a.k.a. RRM, RBD, or RNP domain)